MKNQNPRIVPLIIKRSKEHEKQGLEPTFKNTKKTGQ